MPGSPSPSPKKPTGRGRRSPSGERCAQPKGPASSSGSTSRRAGSHGGSASRRASPSRGGSQQAPPLPPVGASQQPAPPPPAAVRFHVPRWPCLLLAGLLMLWCLIGIGHWASHDRSDLRQRHLGEVFECVVHAPFCDVVLFYFIFINNSTFIPQCFPVLYPISRSGD